MDYNFRAIEAKWRTFWQENKTYKTEIDNSKEKFYVLDMFPYPSGAGLHVGHPLGYIASDIYARYKKHKGFNVLHPMGYDAFGLPAEQYAIQTGQHPAITTAANLKRYREQLDQIGFSYDWDREVRTSDPNYYKWTQWIFLQLFHSYYNTELDKADDIKNLVALFEKEGNAAAKAHGDQETVFTAAEWNAMNEKEQQAILMNYRLTYLSDSFVNWCPALGTVLANDEIKDGVSERGGHPVERKKMQQWSMRITAYAERLLTGLDQLDWTDAIKEIQRNWIGKSVGALVSFEIDQHKEKIDVFTTRPDTIFGVSFMVIAPEHELVNHITTAEQKKAIEAYQVKAAARSERERMADVKQVSGEFTGAYAKHPFSGNLIPIWIADYVLASYGTGAVMAVPGGDQRDWDFAHKFGLTIPVIIEGQNISEGADANKEGIICNSDFLNGLKVKDAIVKAIEAMEAKGIGKGKTNYRLRDAVFSRQRYWGEPIPIYYKNGIATAMDESELPLELPEVDKYLPTEDGEPPLARAENWKTAEGHPIETNTMPGWAGSSWYFARYLDPNNTGEFASQDALNYWKNVDLYMGGAEHATGHLLYARFWTKFLNDKGFLPFDEPFKKMINQGMITGNSRFIYRILFSIDQSGINDNDIIKNIEFDGKLIHISKEYYEAWTNSSITKPDEKNLSEQLKLLIKEHEASETERLKAIYPNFKGKVSYWATPSSIIKAQIPIKHVDGYSLNVEALKNDKEFSNYMNSTFLFQNQFICLGEIEKMSKSKFNVVNPDNIIESYGADTLRLFEMFLGPLEQSKPWDTDSIEGVHRFLRKFWRLFHDGENNFSVTNAEPTKEELKVLHKTIKKVEDDIERFSFNTVVSAFMICVNELNDLKSNNKTILEQLVILITPYAPHIAEELWHKLGNTESVTLQAFPKFEAKYLVESSHKYPVSFNGKMRFMLEMPLDLSKEEIEKTVMEHEESQKWLDGKTPKKVIIVPKKIVNIVI
ncbi:leucine--tRNA ligase [Acidiluteibacter ferrifornacis]|uniref:Leucine--tRNA ligase n=1 Tax=Acidiluteibacter ferrifornacis TaxID=2692424 RepID=A0A6N9NH91_9FLAO|nr:class I tRNA ligase family protein [Acidiluteibacter ferrifornacis]NBG65212.1 leucine--tRNA ligase [Acidiluteibacter ferrifornacis]